MVVSRPMIAQAPDNSWSELLTSARSTGAVQPVFLAQK